jgi:hypothetical protein
MHDPADHPAIVHPGHAPRVRGQQPRQPRKLLVTQPEYLGHIHPPETSEDESHPGRLRNPFYGSRAYAKISNDASDFDRDTRNLSDPGYPIRDYEAVAELTYLAQLSRWWTAQFDVQYIVQPGGTVQNPNNASETVDNAILFGLRTTIAL